MHYKELDELMDKYKLIKVDRHEEDRYVEENDPGQTLMHYEDYLQHADKLVARDSTWKHIYYDYSDEEDV